MVPKVIDQKVDFVAKDFLFENGKISKEYKI
jgi:hypothetical protein